MNSTLNSILDTQNDFKYRISLKTLNSKDSKHNSISIIHASLVGIILYACILPLRGEGNKGLVYKKNEQYAHKMGNSHDQENQLMMNKRQH